MSATTVSARSPARPRSSAKLVPEFVPTPLVPWTDVVDVYSAPGQQPTRSRLRTLRGHNLASQGVQVPRRGDIGVEGTASYHSALSVWSARLRQVGLEELADQMRTAASKIEQTYSAYLRAYLLHHEFMDLDKADFYLHLVKDTADALADFRWMDENMQVIVGEVKHHHGTWHIAGVDRAGAEWDERVFPSVLQRKNLAEGSPVVLTARVTSSGLVFEVEPAVPVPSDEDLANGSPFTEEEYAELAARYCDSGGRRPSAKERKQVASRHDGKSVRRRKVTLDE